MHILVPVLHRPEKPTGVCRHAVNLAQCLAEQEKVEKISLVIGNWQTNYFNKSFSLSNTKIHLVEVPLRNSSISRNFWYLFGLPKLAAQLNPDIIHLSFPFPVIRQWFSAPIVATIHDLYPYEYPENFGYPQVWFNQWFLNQCIANSDGLSCVSKNTLKSLKLFLPRHTCEKPVKVVYNSVDFKAAAPTRPRALNLKEHQPFILSVAQHRKNKNLDLLIRAYNKLFLNQTVASDTHLVLVGSDGPETYKLNKLVDELRLQDNVTFLAGLEDGELQWLYKNTALFVIASSTEATV
jgi:glycosyltransferase involved in cell wall biosynthesis